MEPKKRFKLYKSGKLWCLAAIAFAAFTVGTSVQAHADVTTQSVPQTQTVQLQKSAEQSTTTVDVTPHSVGPDTTTIANQVDANQGNLDSYQIQANPKTGEATLDASGWHASGRSNDERYRYAILYDNTTHNEISRQAVTPQTRSDVQKAYPHIDNSLQSGFNVQFKLPSNLSGHSISLVARYSTDAVNCEGQHTDYWFSPIIINNDNRASLDNLSSDEDGTLHVSGWHASNQAMGKKYHYLIVFDQTTGHEITRTLITNDQTRTDVAKAFPMIANAAFSGFDTTFKLNPEYASHNIQFVSRWTNDPAGNGNATDFWFDPVNKQNRGNLDSWNVSDGNLQISGWHANDASIYQPNHFLILFDNTINRQVASIKAPLETSTDVAKAFGDTRSAGRSRFNTIFDQPNLTAGHTYSLVSRYSFTGEGNGDDGNGADHTDYWYSLGTLNGSGFSIDNWQAKNRQLTISGWFANDQSLHHQYPYVILLAGGREIARHQVTLTNRGDVANAYPHISGSLKSGFTTTFTLPNNVDGDFQLVLRFSNAENGEGDHQDIWTGTYTTNAGSFDNVTVNGNSLHVSGWHATVNSDDRPYQYIIAVDMNGNEMNRWNITDQGSHQSRGDVQKAYPWITGSEQSGFTLNANNIDPNRYAYFKLIHRYTDDQAGNGNYVDYAQWIDRTNYQQRLTDAWRNIINSRVGHIGIAVKSQLTGQIYSYTNAPGYHWWTASTVKASVLSELLHRTGGNLDGTMQNLATQMIRYSDNAATTAIVNNYLGGVNGLYGLFHAEGMNDTYTTPNGWGTTSTTPVDQVKLLNDLYLDQNSGYLNQQSRDYVHYQMSHVSYGQDWGISAGTPRGSFYIKNGWIPMNYGRVNSIGFIPASDNRHGYAIAVYTDANPSFQYGIDTIQALALATKRILQG